ncbi:MAG TPA: RsmE family RNA methyltransferase [Candidatus Saccharimonadales bacterium]|nr:RsmE family RNA methyltransferase [Candidatus Saccharimonadales bacterium]
MRLHRFYTGPDIRLKEDFWLHDELLLWQWHKVLRFRTGQQIVLFDGQAKQRLYKIAEISKNEAHLQLITDMPLKRPKRHIYLFWSLLKRENNEYIIQKCTEVGVSNFVPVISERTVKKDFNMARAQKIAVEASEQCGRTDIPLIREPVRLDKVLEEYRDKLKLIICDEGGPEDIDLADDDRTGLFIGPEGGWSDHEQKMFSESGIMAMGLGDFTLRAETAAIVASSKFL